MTERPPDCCRDAFASFSAKDRAIILTYLRVRSFRKTMKRLNVGPGRVASTLGEFAFLLERTFSVTRVTEAAAAAAKPLPKQADAG